MGPAGAEMSIAHRYWLCFLGVLVIGIVVLIAYTQVAVEGWDPVAYLYAGQRLAEGEMPSVCSHFNAEIGPYFTLAGFNIRVGNNQECLFLNYPPGFPMLLAIAQKLVGKLEAALYVPAIMGGLGLLFTFISGTWLFDKPEVGLIAASLLFCSPTFLQFNTSPWSDGPGMSLLMGGVAAVLFGERSKTSIVQMVAGWVGALLIGWSIFTRYVNGLALIPVVSYLGLKHKATVVRKWHVLSFIVCTVFVIIGLLLFNRAYFGGYFSTPYSPAHGWYDWPAFSVSYAFGKSPVGEKSLEGAAQTLFANYSWLLLLAGIGFLRMPLPERALVFGGSLIFIALYSFYVFAPTGINARFLLPAFPFLGISIGYAFVNLISGKHWRWYRLSVVSIAATMLIPLPGRLQELVQRNAAATAYVEKIVHLTENTEPDAVFLAYHANDAIAYYGQRTTLFYRRIPVTGDFEHRFVAICEALLRKRLPMYFVADGNPPFGNIRIILQNHFELIPMNTDPPLYKIRPWG